MDTTQSPEFSAKFPKAEYAEEFAARIQNEGYWATNITQKGRTVTWDSAIPEDSPTTKREHFMDCLEHVGYVGSTQNRKATLNGVPAPMAY